jgi:hypothetical protein
MLPRRGEVRLFDLLTGRKLSVRCGAGYQPAAALRAALLIYEEACWKQAAGSIACPTRLAAVSARVIL